MIALLIVWGISAVCLYGYGVWYSWWSIRIRLSAGAAAHAGPRRLVLAALSAALPTGATDWRLYLLGPVGLLVVVLTRPKP